MGARSQTRTPNDALRAARRRLNLSQDELAEALRENGWASCERRTIQRYESGEVTRPRPFACRALTELFALSMGELGFPGHEVEEVDDVNRRQLLTLTAAAASQAIETAPGGDLSISAADAYTGALPTAPGRAAETPEQVHDDEALRRRSTVGGEAETLRRRELLQALSVLGASIPAVEALRRIQSSMDDALGSDDSLHVSEWEEAVAEYGYSYVAQPPSMLLPDLAADLVSVRNTMQRNNLHGARYRDWSRVVAGLSMLMAKTLSNLGRPREARGWWATAQRACVACGDDDLGLWVNAERLFHGMYDSRPVAALLNQANQITARYPTASPSRGMAPIRTGRAQLLAMTGRDAEAVAELRRAQEVFERLPSEVTSGTESIAFWAVDRLHYTETWVYAHLGEINKVDGAVAKAHAAIPASQRRAHTQLDLLQAFGHTRGGDVAAGTTLAASAYESLTGEHRTTMVTTLASMVLGAIPASRRIDSGATRYRELLASTHGLNEDQ